MNACMHSFNTLRVDLFSEAFQDQVIIECVCFSGTFLYILKTACTNPEPHQGNVML